MCVQLFQTNGSRLVDALKGISLSVGLPIISALVSTILIERDIIEDAAPLFLVGVILAATQAGGRMALVAALVSFALLSFLLVEPRFTFQLASADDFLVLLIFLFVALAVAHFAGQARDRGQAALERAKQLEALFDAACRALISKDNHLVAVIAQEAAEAICPMGWQISAEDPRLTDDATPMPAGSPGRGRQTKSSHQARVIELCGPENSLFIYPTKAGEISAGTEQSFAMLAKLAEGALTRICLQQELEDTKVAAAAESLRAIIINSVAHDFRTPLSSIIASAATLEDHHHAISEAEKVNLARSIRIGAERLSRFVSKLLTAAQLDSGAIKAHLQVVDVRDVMGGLLEAFSTHKHRSSVIWDGSFADVEIQCDPVLLDQALHNIVENCLDFSPPGSPVRVTIQVGPFFDILICDEGIGIAPPYREEIFKRWARGPQSSKSRSGLGLGLAIANGFIHALGGTITVIDKPDGARGACFRVRFPMSVVEGHRAAV